MFSKKKDLDQHVQELFRKTKSEKERNGKCLTIARQYAQLNDWPTCRRYVGAYIQDHPNSAPALRLLAECESNLGNKESALNNYRSSLTYDSNQKDVVFKVCELLCSVEVDSDMYQYWVDRAEGLDSSHPSVFKLKEHILTLAAAQSSGIGVSLELEDLIMAEQKARPSDPKPSIRLLQLYVDKKQETKAFSLAQEKESDSPHRNDITWYQALVKTVEECQHRVENGWEFYSFKLLVLERLAFLSLDEEIAANQPSNKVFSKQANLDILVDTVFKLDQALFEAKKISQPSAPSRRAMADHFLKHMSAQLSFYLACILFKKAKKDSSQWKSCSKMCGPLLLLSHQAQPPEESVAWIKDLPISLANTCKLWIKDGHLRKSQAGNILLGLNSKKKYIDYISPMLVTKWQDELYKKIFPNSKEEKTSYLKTSLDSNKLYRTLPTPNDLFVSDEAAQLHLYQHLHLLVWYGLRYKAAGHSWAPLNEANDDPSQVALDMLPKRSLCKAFPSLKRFNKELPGISQATPESLSQMDLDAFIFSSVTCAAGVLDENQMRWSEDRPDVLPAALTDSLCTPAQKLWWKNICHILRPETPNHSVSTEVRKLIRIGLEAIRSVDSQSGHQDVRLLSALARLFSAQAAKANEEGEDEQLITSLYLRASHYWSCAKPSLENIKSGRSVRLSSQDRFFHLSGKELERSAAESLLYEACFSEGMQLVRNNRLEEAIEAFGDLSSPYASIQQALLYRRLGDAEKSDMSIKEIYLKRSLDNFYVTLDRLKGPKVDPRHPLNNSLRSHIEEVEELINGLFPNAHLQNPVQKELSDGSDEEDYSSPSVHMRGHSSTPFTSSRARPVTLANGTPLNGRQRTMATPLRSPAISTPRPREEARPSPERLEAQMRQLSVQRESELQAMARIVEASRSNDSSIRNELQYVKDSVRDITRDMQSHQREVMEQRREIQDLNKNVKEIQTDVQKILKLLKTTHISHGRSTVPVREARNIPDEELYMYGDDDLENEMEQNQPQQNPAAAAAMMAAGNLPAAMYNAYPFRAPPPNYFPLARGVDATALMYQNLAYLAPGALPFSEGQRLPEFQVATPQLLGGVVPIPTNPQMATTGFNTVPPIITEISPVQTPPQMQPEMPTAALNLTSISTIFEASPHAYQISMPAEAQIPTASPLDKAPKMPQISPQSMLQNVPSPTYSSVTPESSKKSSRAARVSVGSAVSEDDIPEHDAMSDFKPIIPLPDEIVQTTGEEDETVLFENRAKLFRFVEGEWKERGIGVLKVLESNTTKKARILMRREQVLKVCCNHVVPSDIVLKHISGNDKTWSWSANDFADEKMRLENLGVRFKTVEEADAFRDVIEKVKATMPKSPNSKVPSTPTASVIVPSPATTPALPATPATPAAPTRAPLLSTPKINFLPSTPNNNTAAAATVSMGGFTFTSAPSVTAKPQEAKAPETQKKEETAKPSPFAAFTFSSVFGKAGAPTTTDTTPTLASTTVFQNSPMSQMSFSTIASSASAATPPFGTLTPSKGFGTPSLVFGSATTPAGSTATPADSTSASSPGAADSENADDFVPTADFKPVVPLPELIEVKTGEEGEEVLFEQRAKLLRYVSESREWKERGIGKMKMTWNPESCKVRLIMRREQVLKVCCNHFLAKDMKLLPISSSDRSWTWSAQDYSDGTLETETFALKFKLPEDAALFRDKWLELQEEMDDSNHYFKDGKKPVVKAQTTTQQPLSGMFKPAQGNWECQMCYVSNKAEITTCAACSTPKPGAAAAAVPPKAAAPALTADKDLMKQFKKPEGSWSCDLCYVQNKSDDKKCAACETPRPGASPEKAAAPATKNIAPGLTFDFKTPSKGASQFSFGFNPAATLAAPATTAAAPMWATSAPAPAFSFGTSSTPATTSTTSFAFGSTQPSFSFGLSGSKEATTTTSTPSFGFSMPPVTPASSIASAAFSSPQVENEESDDEVENDEGEHIHFAPVIPLPDMVQVVTGEEDEEVLYSHRAKLFRWAGNEWKERGLGDIKILKHRENGNIRLLMRREQVLKICLNHRLSSDIAFLPKGDTNRSFQWYASDFSEGEMRQEHFAVLFKTEDIATDFLDAALVAQSSLSDQSISAQAASPGQISAVSTVDTSTVLDTSEASSAQFQTPSKSFSFVQDSDPSAAVTPSFSFNSTAKDFTKKSLFGDASATTSDDDVKILEVIEPKVSAEEIAKARELQLPDNFYAYKQRPDCKGCPGCDKEEDTLEPKSIKEKSPPKTTSIFGSTTFGTPISTSSEKSSVNGNIASSNINFFMPAGNTTTFASLAQDNVKTGFGNLATGANTFAWGGAATPVFGSGSKPAPIFGSGQKPAALFSSPSDSAKKKDGESSGEEEGDETHDPHFDPIIALPDIITVRTGEEDEEKVFCQRGKLYRYDGDTREWKERGVGEMKLLLHQATGRYRLLLRREQVHKVVLNQLLTKDLDMQPLKTSNNALCWGALNYAEDEPRAEQLAVKFKNEDILSEFKTKVVEAKERLAAQAPASMPILTGPSPPASTSPGKGPRTPPINNEECEEEEEEEEEEEDDEDDYETYDEDYPESVVTESRGTVFARKDGDPLGPWLGLGVGLVKTLFYPDVGHYNVVVELDVSHGGETVRITVDSISHASSERTQDKEICFSGMNEAQDANRVEYYKVLFENAEATEEFQNAFMEGLALAENLHESES